MNKVAMAAMMMIFLLFIIKLFLQKKSMCLRSYGSWIFLRKGRDSNSWYGYPYDSLANCWFQPLTHPSPRLSVLGHVMSEMLFFSKAAAKVLQKMQIRKFFWKKMRFCTKKARICCILILLPLLPPHDMRAN